MSALPWLDAMLPAFARPPRARPRALFVFSPNGMDMSRWRPRGDGRRVGIGETLQPLQPWRDRLTVFSGLDISGGPCARRWAG